MLSRTAAPRQGARLLAFALVVAFCSTASAQGLPAAPAASVGMSAQKLERISAAFKKEIDQGKFPGAVVLVARKGKLVYADAVGLQDKAAGKAMAKDSLFRIYSMSKPLVSVAAMMLVEEGRIQLTDPVSKYLPPLKTMTVSVAKADAEFAKISYTQVPADREMTVQDLLRHTAGLAYGEITQNAPVKEALGKAGIYKTAIDYDARDLAPAEQVERLSKVPLAHQPGTVWEYSLASDILGRVVEAAAGERLGDFLDKRLFKPLKMTDTAFWLPREKLGRLAEPLATDPVSGKPIVLIDVTAQPAADSGGAGGVSSAADYLRFSQMLLNGGAYGSTRLLAHNTVRMMTMNQIGDLYMTGTENKFGFGFSIITENGSRLSPSQAGTFAWGGLFSTSYWVDPKEDMFVIIYRQMWGPNVADTDRAFKPLVYQAMND